MRWWPSKSGSGEYNHINQEMYKQNLELSEKNSTLLLLQRIDESVLGSARSTVAVPQMVTDLLVRESNFNLAIIYTKNEAPDTATATGMSIQRQLSVETENFIKNHIGSLSVLSASGNDLAELISSNEIHIADDF